MNEAKPFASLSSGLLARKGTAKPAMRPQGFGSYGSSLEDLGWDDMGHPGPLSTEHVPSSITALTPSPGGRVHELHPARDPDSNEEDSYALEAPEFADEQDPDFDEGPEPELAEPEPREPEAARPASREPEPAEDVRQLIPRDYEPEAESAEAEMAEPDLAEPVESAPELAEPAILEQQRALEASFEAPAPVLMVRKRAPAPAVTLPKRAAAPSVVSLPARAKAAFTLRLDPERHLRLRLACAVTRRSAQQIVTGALDEYLGSLPELEALAGHVPAAAGKNGRR